LQRSIPSLLGLDYTRYSGEVGVNLDILPIDGKHFADRPKRIVAEFEVGPANRAMCVSYSHFALEGWVSVCGTLGGFETRTPILPGQWPEDRVERRCEAASGMDAEFAGGIGCG
jgi:hypothetical protein